MECESPSHRIHTTRAMTGRHRSGQTEADRTVGGLCGLRGGGSGGGGGGSRRVVTMAVASVWCCVLVELVQRRVRVLRGTVPSRRARRPPLRMRRRWMLRVLRVRRLLPPLRVRVRVARISAMRAMLRRRVARVAAASCVPSAAIAVAAIAVAAIAAAAIAAAAVHRGLRTVESGLRTVERRRGGRPLLLCCGWPRNTAAATT